MTPPLVNRKVRRAPRVDGARNRERLVATALVMFAEHGISVSVEDIAKRAEVGIGTLYRHFPTKDALMAAIVVERLAQVSAYAESCRDAKDAGAALAAVLQRLVHQCLEKKDLVEAIGGHDKLEGTGVEAVRRRFRVPIAALLRRAQKAGQIRRDVTADDLVALVRGISLAGSSAKASARHLSIMLAGLSCNA